MNSRNKKVIVPILLVLAVSLWLYNFYQIIIGVSQDNEEIYQPMQQLATSTLTINKTAKRDSTYVYKGDFRDPFHHWLNVVQKAMPSNGQTKNVTNQKHKKQNVRKTKVPFPQLRYRGLIRDDKGTMAIITLPDGAMLFSTVGDTISGAMLNAIHEDAIICTFQEREYTVKLR